MTIIADGRGWRAHFESVSDVAHFIDTNPCLWKENTTQHRGYIYDSDSWTLGDKEPDIQRYARNGWEKGTERLHRLLEGRPATFGTVTEWGYDVAGFLPDVPRLLGGNPDCMMRHKPIKGDRPIVSICVQVWINAGISAAEMLNYGAAMVSWIDHIEAQGKRCEIWAVCAAPHGYARGKRLSASWVVKQAQDHIDMAALAFSLTHPGASRRFGWRVWERICPITDHYYGSGGFKTTIDDVVDPPNGMLFLKGTYDNFGACKSIDTAIPYVAKQINEAAGETIVEISSDD